MICRVLLLLVCVSFISVIGFSQVKYSNIEFRKEESWTEDEKAFCFDILDSYSELESTRIIFKKSSLKSMGQAQPVIFSLLRRRSSRKYKITLRECKEAEQLCYNQIPDSAKVGLIGHELFHIVDYQSKSIFAIAWLGFRYPTSTKYRRDVEFETDSLTIVRGFGSEVLYFFNFVTSSSCVSKKYLRRKEKYYMKREDIIRIMNR